MADEKKYPIPPEVLFQYTQPLNIILFRPIRFTVDPKGWLLGKTICKEEGNPTPRAHPISTCPPKLTPCNCVVTSCQTIRSPYMRTVAAVSQKRRFRDLSQTSASCSTRLPSLLPVRKL